MKVISRSIQPITLSHEAYCLEIGECRCTEADVSSSRKNPITGARIVSVVKKKFPPVVTLLAGRAEDLPDAV